MSGERPILLFAGLLVAWTTLDPALVEPAGLLASGPELVDERFSRCAGGRSRACVVDGDTFRLGDRRIRIIGIDAPETSPPRCPAEARLGAAATERLAQLLSQGPFEMVGRIGDMRDRYGRELRALRRLQSDGSYRSIAAQMREEGLARRYLGGLRGGWC